MTVVVVAGTTKGDAIRRADETREKWAFDDLARKGWQVTAASMGKNGKAYTAVASDVYGPATPWGDMPAQTDIWIKSRNSLRKMRCSMRAYQRREYLRAETRANPGRPCRGLTTIPIAVGENGGRAVQGATILEAFPNAARLEPILAGHSFDDVRVIRRHIQCVHNENDYYRARDGLDIAGAPGDTVALMNAVFGGTG